MIYKKINMNMVCNQEREKNHWEGWDMIREWGLIKIQSIKI